MNTNFDSIEKRLYTLWHTGIVSGRREYGDDLVPQSGKVFLALRGLHHSLSDQEVFNVEPAPELIRVTVADVCQRARHISYQSPFSTLFDSPLQPDWIEALHVIDQTYNFTKL